MGRSKEADSRADVVEEPASGAEAADMRRLTGLLLIFGGRRHYLF